MKTFRRAAVCCGLLAALAGLILYPQEASAAVRDGLRLCAQLLIPSLFPFFLCINLAANLGVTDLLARAAAPLMRALFHVSGDGSAVLLFGLLGGYPAGAQCAAALRRTGRISQEEADYLLLFCNNAGPAFLFGVAGSLFGGVYAALLLWGAQMVSALLLGLLHRPRTLPPAAPPAAKDAQPFSAAFLAAVQDAAQTCFQVMAFVTAFSVLARFLTLGWKVFAPPESALLLGGLLELSSGLCALGASSLPALWKLTAAGGLCAFGGLCVLLQTKAVLASAGLRGRGIPGAKAAQALLAALLTFLFARLLPLEAVPAAQFSVPLCLFPIQAALAAGFCLVCRKLRLDIPAETRYNRRK